MANVEPIQIVEIDIDYCTLTYSVGSCTAVLGTTGVRKCFNTFATCQDTNNFDKGVKTLRFITPTANAPKGNTVYFPALKSVSAFSSSVNIGGANPKYGALGKRGKVTVDLEDFAYHDRYLDKYQSERVDGSAQTDESGYDPVSRGSFFTKLKSRFPYYAGRALRVKSGYIDNGSLTITQTRHFVITEMKGPADTGRVTIEAKDILTLAEKKTATAPTVSGGELASDIAVDATSLSLLPSGIGGDYPTSGYAVIGSEIIGYTRSGDDITISDRGLFGSTASTHSSGDTFQEAIVYTDANIDDVVSDLLTNYTNIPSSYLPTTDWASEIDRWASTLLINTVITKPTPVAELLGELAVLGVSIWWDDVAQEIKMKATKPVDLDQTVYEFTDDANIKKITQDDRDEDRLTQIHFYTVQSDPTNSVKDKGNYDRIRVTVDSVAEQANAYDEPRIREIFCRWVNQGADAPIRIRALRLLNRFNTAPKLFNIKVDIKDVAVGLTDVVDVTSRVVTDDTGKAVTTRLEVIQKSEPVAGHEIDLIAQAYLYEGKYGFVMQNTANGYDTATDLEKEQGCYISDEAGVIFTDDPYLII